MNILYISCLSNDMANGMALAVPGAVSAQSKYDNVLWVNVSASNPPHWHDVPTYHNISEFEGELRLRALPAPFNHPDLAVLEGFYVPQPALFAFQLRRAGIPYMVRPHGGLTAISQQKNRLKKWLGNTLLFRHYVRKATGVVFLTENEYRSSGAGWNRHHFISPNGVTIPVETKQTFFAGGGIHAVYIGRLDLFHKGIDWILDAVGELQNELRSVGFTLAIYGPHRASYDALVRLIAARGIGDIVSLPGEVWGEEKRQALLAADLFVLTSRSEGHPMGLIEALAYGVPALITRGANMLEEIREADAGWACEAGRDNVREALRQCISERDRFAAKGRAAANLAKRYDWDKIAQRFHCEVSKLLDELHTDK